MEQLEDCSRKHKIAAWRPNSDALAGAIEACPPQKAGGVIYAIANIQPDLAPRSLAIHWCGQILDAGVLNRRQKWSIQAGLLRRRAPTLITRQKLAGYVLLSQKPQRFPLPLYDMVSQAQTRRASASAHAKLEWVTLWCFITCVAIFRHPIRTAKTP